MKQYQKKLDQLYTEFSSGENGLSTEQAVKNCEKFGRNVITEGKKKSIPMIFLEQYKDFLVLILIIAAIVSAFMKDVESCAVILVVITMNAILGTVQTVKAEKSLTNLKKLSAPTAKALRNGEKVIIPSEEIAVGDILLIEAGDQICADGRLIECASVQVNESALTGESVNIDKDMSDIEGEKPLAERANMVYSGSFVTYGRGKMLVTEVGMDTEVGKIASLIQNASERKTPLQNTLDEFGKKLSIAILIVCAVVFGLSMLRGGQLMDSFMFAIALAVAAIPEALSSIVTIVLSFGTQKMSKENAIIRKLQAVEGLGSVSVICSDKTGTLTQNKMTVRKIMVDGRIIDTDAVDLDDEKVKTMTRAMILCNDSSCKDGVEIGDPTETALINFGTKLGIDTDKVREDLPRISEIPFDSDRKLMSTKYRLHGVPTILVKGALDILLKRTDRIRIGDEVRPITEQDVKEILDKNQAFSEQGLRVLAFAYKEAQANQQLTLDEEDHLIFIGLVSMIDPPREESREAVSEAKRAGIRPVMITGDHKITATAIAEQIGIFGEGDMAVTGPELDEMSDAELDENIEKISVYARVSPENKIRIVDAWQRKGAVTAMTGDGVNDAPALKKADIGVAMGITGTEVSKDAASMILTDDNFATIIKAVANGRNVYRNIKNAVKFLLSGNMAGIMAVLYTSLAALPVPFQPVHLLFINLLTDSLPAIAIGMEKAEKDLLSEQPRDPKQGILTKDLMTALFVQGGLIAVCTMIAFYIGLSTDSATASSMAFATLTLARLFHGFNCRSRHSIFKIGLASNIYSVGAFFGGVLLLALVIFVPVMRTLFTVSPLSGYQIGMIALLAFIPTVIIQLYKVMKEHVHA